MTTSEKGDIIGRILQRLKTVAKIENKPFDESDTFFSLLYKTPEELNNIAKLCNI